LREDSIDDPMWHILNVIFCLSDIFGLRKIKFVNLKSEYRALQNYEIYMKVKIIIIMSGYFGLI